MKRLCMIGFGEAAYAIAKGLVGEGFNNITAYDIRSDDEKMQARAKEIGVVLKNEEEAYKDSDFIVSLTSAASAFEVAQEIIPHLTAGQCYVDMNSASPAVMEAIDHIPRSTGVLFCDCAVMGTVPGNGHLVPMFLTGDGAEAFGTYFQSYGMKLTTLSSPAGGASAIKMIKSVVMKGIPQLFFEAFEAAEKYEVLDKLIESLNKSLTGKTIETLADTFIARTLIHAERRIGEMKDVAKTLAEADVDKTMTEAVIQRLTSLNAVADGKWKDILKSDTPYDEAIQILIEKRQEKAGE